MNLLSLPIDNLLSLFNVQRMGYIKSDKGGLSNATLTIHSTIDITDNSIVKINFDVTFFEPSWEDYYKEVFDSYKEALNKYNELLIKWGW